MRCYFDLVSESQTIPDDDGVEVEELAQAISEAHAAMREMREGEEFEQLPGSWSLVIRGEDGATLATLPIC